MNPRDHTEHAVTVVCDRCGATVPAEQAVTVDDERCCGECVRAAVRASRSASISPGARKHPLAAVVASVVPGAGQTYNGQVKRGLVFLVIVLLSLLQAERHPADSAWIYVVFLAWTFAAFDAYHGAECLNAGGRLRDDLTLVQPSEGTDRSPSVWGYLLVAVAATLLIENLWPVQISLRYAGPTIALVLGLWFIFGRVRRGDPQL